MRSDRTFQIAQAGGNWTLQTMSGRIMMTMERHSCAWDLASNNCRAAGGGVEPDCNLRRTQRSCDMYGDYPDAGSWVYGPHTVYVNIICQGTRYPSAECVTKFM